MNLCRDMVCLVNGRHLTSYVAIRPSMLLDNPDNILPSLPALGPCFCKVYHSLFDRVRRDPARIPSESDGLEQIEVTEMARPLPIRAIDGVC